MELSKNIFWKLAVFVTPILLISLFITLDIERIFSILRNARLVFIFSALATLPIEFFLKSVRLGTLIKPAATSFSNRLIITLIGLPLGTITPARIGDFAKIYTLSKKTSVSAARCLAIGISEKLFDFLSLLILAIAGIATLLLTHKTIGITVGSVYISLFLLLAFALFFTSLNRKILQALFGFIARFIPPKHKIRLEYDLNDFLSNIVIPFHKKETSITSWAIAFMLWINRLIRIYFLALAVNIQANFIFFVLAVPIIELIEILPISIMGFGTREYTHLFLFSLVGISKESAIALSLLGFAVTAIPFSAIGYIVMLKEYVLNAKNT